MAGTPRCRTVDSFTERPDYRQLCYAVIDAVIEIRESSQIRPDHIESFAKAAECSYEFVFGCGLKRLIETAHFSELAANKLRALRIPPPSGDLIQRDVS